MGFSIHNCNNIDSGTFEITRDRLNVKYGINGTGKTTISKALEAFIKNDESYQKSLKPFKYIDEKDNKHEPNRI